MLLLDDYVCHKQDKFIDKLSEVNTLLSLIPPGYTSVLQPCDVGINKPLKSRLQNLASDWRAAQIENLGANDKVPAPGRKDVCGWLKRVWDEFPPAIIESSFRKSGYVCEEDNNYDSDRTETDSDDLN